MQIDEKRPVGPKLTGRSHIRRQPQILLANAFNKKLYPFGYFHAVLYYLARMSTVCALAPIRSMRSHTDI